MMVRTMGERALRFVMGKAAGTKRSAAEVAPTVPAEKEEDAGRRTTEALRVLIVEDHPDTARMLADLVEAWGFHAAVAPTGKDARRIAPQFHPRVVLLDLGLPDEPGYRVAQELRRNAGQSPLSFVVVTGWSQPVDQTVSMQAGISHHLVKPVNTEALHSILDAYDTRRVA